MEKQKFSFINLMFQEILVILVLFLLLLPISIKDVTAQTSQDVSSASYQQTPQGPTDPKELEIFMDGILTTQMKAHHIPGATVAVVKDGEMYFTKGYGYADLEKHKPVVADKTLFRVGSISKLITWTAVMQLVEQGRLELNADVNNYLQEFQIPDTYPQPITMAHLLTHTPGFEFKWIGEGVRSASDLVPLGEYLANHIPGRIRPPGELSTYTNFSASLVGYIVEQVSGIPFEQYIEDNILKPLSMHHSTFQQPLPLDLKKDMSIGYSYTDGAYKEGEISYICQDVPAADLSTTATDMAKFMIAHLQNGRYGKTRILQEDTAQEMYRQHFTNDPRVSGWTYGFAESHTNNQQIIWHMGIFNEFYSILFLLPEQNLGLYVSYNSPGGAKAMFDLQNAFLDRYFPVSKTPTPQPTSYFWQRASRFTGDYISSAFNQTTPEKLGILLETVKVNATKDDTLQIGTGQEATQWVEVEPLVFRNILSDGILVFREDEQHRITHMFFDEDPYDAYTKLPWYKAPPFHWGLLGTCVVLFLSVVVVWPIGFLFNRRKVLSRTLLSRLARWLVWGLSALNLLFVAAVYILMNSDEMYYGVPSIVDGLLVIPLLNIVLVIGFVIFAMLAWKKRFWSVFGRLHYTLITITLLAYIWWLGYWNLLGFQF